MLLTRASSTLRAVATLAKSKNQVTRLSVRNHGACNYRTPPQAPSKNALLVAELVQGTMWWWILWHCWTEPGHIFGEFDYPDAKKWTDEELGIPSELELDE